MSSALSLLRDCVRRALVEDLGREDLCLQADVTGRLSVPPALLGLATTRAKATGVLAGMDCAREAFQILAPAIVYKPIRRDGDLLRPHDVVFTAQGPMQALLVAERTALNFLQRLSGIATLTRAFVDAVAGTKAKIFDTRKTTPGLRILEKQAVLAGGGQNHRIGLYDQVLLKENHFERALPMSYEQVVSRCVQGQSAPVVAEARTVDEAIAAVRGGALVILLDNFAPGELLATAVRRVRAMAEQLGATVQLEASGGVRLDNVRAFAESGVDRISIGALTHSAQALDLSMLVETFQ